MKKTALARILALPLVATLATAGFLVAPTPVSASPTPSPMLDAECEGCEEIKGDRDVDENTVRLVAANGNWVEFNLDVRFLPASTTWPSASNCASADCTSNIMIDTEITAWNGPGGGGAALDVDFKFYRSNGTELPGQMGAGGPSSLGEAPSINASSVSRCNLGNETVTFTVCILDELEGEFVDPDMPSNPLKPFIEVTFDCMNCTGIQ